MVAPIATLSYDRDHTPTFSLFFIHNSSG